MLIWKQKPDASYVGGFNTWLKCGRYVKRGEKGIAILAPVFFKDKNAAGDETKRIRFRVVYVFDISQTNGTPLPELPSQSTGERGAEMLTRLLAFAESRGIAVRLREAMLPKRSCRYITREVRSITGRLTLTSRRKQQPWPTKSRIHCCTGIPMARKSPRATARKSANAGGNYEAEATAYVVSNYFGVQSPSEFYLAAYDVTPAMYPGSGRDDSADGEGNPRRLPAAEYGDSASVHPNAREC